MDWSCAEESDQCAAARVSGRRLAGSVGGVRETWIGTGGGRGWKDAEETAGSGVEGADGRGEWVELRRDGAE
jgi:hypothetical protein